MLATRRDVEIGYCATMDAAQMISGRLEVVGLRWHHYDGAKNLSALVRWNDSREMRVLRRELLQLLACLEDSNY